MKMPKGVKYKPFRSRRCKGQNGTLPPACRCGPSNILAQGGPNSGTGPDCRKFHFYKRVLLRDFRDGLNLQDQLAEAGL